MIGRFLNSCRLWIVPVSLVLLSLATSCKRIPLYDPLTNVYLKLDLQLKIDVELSADIQIDGNPELEAKVYGKKTEMVRACFYDSSTHKLVTDEFLAPEGGFVNIAPGVYDVMVYSLGTETTQITGTDSRGMAYAFTSQTGTRVKVQSKAGGESEPVNVNVIYEPDHVWVGRVSGVVIPAQVAEVREVTTIVIESSMTPLLETYTLQIKNVNGAGNIRKADIYVTGQAPGKYLWDGRYSFTPVAISFPMVVAPGDGKLLTVFNTFGKLPGVEADVIMNILVTTEGGGRYQWTFDVTDQFDNPDNTGHEIIIDEPVDVPSPDAGAGGFMPTVDDWAVEIVDIPLS